MRKLDYMGSTELIANLFRIFRPKKKLKRDEVSTAAVANNTHYEVAEKIQSDYRNGRNTAGGSAVPRKVRGQLNARKCKLRNSKKS